MPSYSEVKVKLMCPSCNQYPRSLRRVVRFQWGKVPAGYRMGDPITWRCDESGHVLPPFTYLQKDGPDRFNVGDPRYEDVIVFEMPLIAKPHCDLCGAEFEHLALTIKGGALNSARLFGIGDVEKVYGPHFDPNTCDIIIMNQDGSFEPKYEWNDVPIKPYCQT